jgi:Protein of unknown function (DUF1059)
VESKERVLRCDCGFEVRAEHEDALVAEVRRHAREEHSMALTSDEALLLAFRTELEARTPTSARVGGAVHDASQHLMRDEKEEEER